MNPSARTTTSACDPAEYTQRYRVTRAGGTVLISYLHRARAYRSVPSSVMTTRDTTCASYATKLDLPITIALVHLVNELPLCDGHETHAPCHSIRLVLYSIARVPNPYSPFSCPDAKCPLPLSTETPLRPSTLTNAYRDMRSGRAKPDR